MIQPRADWLTSEDQMGGKLGFIGIVVGAWLMGACDDDESSPDAGAASDGPPAFLDASDGATTAGDVGDAPADHPGLSEVPAPDTGMTPDLATTSDMPSPSPDIAPDVTSSPPDGAPDMTVDTTPGEPTCVTTPVIDPAGFTSSDPGLVSIPTAAAQAYGCVPGTGDYDPKMVAFTLTTPRRAVLRNRHSLTNPTVARLGVTGGCSSSSTLLKAIGRKCDVAAVDLQPGGYAFMQCQPYHRYLFSLESTPATSATNTTCGAALDLDAYPNGYAEPRVMDGSHRYYRITVGDNPAGTTVETALFFSAFDGQDVVVTAYASCGGAPIALASGFFCGNFSESRSSMVLPESSTVVLEISRIQPGSRYTVSAIRL